MVKKLIMLGGVGGLLFSGLFASPVRASESDKATNLTVNTPIDIEGTTLTPGHYLLKLLDSNTGDVVQIFNDDDRVITTVLTDSTVRLEPTGKPVFSFYETRKSEVPALRTYFYPGDTEGFEFHKR